MTIQEEYLICEYMGVRFEDYKYLPYFDKIFEVADRIEAKEGYALVMYHNKFLFKNLATEGYAPAQTDYKYPGERRIAAHGCLVKMIKYINALKKGRL